MVQYHPVSTLGLPAMAFSLVSVRRSKSPSSSSLSLDTKIISFFYLFEVGLKEAVCLLFRLAQGALEPTPVLNASRPKAFF